MERARRHYRRGVAAMVVLFLIMAVTILSFSYLSKSYINLAGSQNISIRNELDYLAESGIEHARGLLLDSSDLSLGAPYYWTGSSGLQLDDTSKDYYDVSIVRDDANSIYGLKFLINSTAYREDSDGSKMAQSKIIAEYWNPTPRFAFWSNDDVPGLGNEIPSAFTINGAVYIDDMVTVNGNVNGSLYAKGAITGIVNGSTFPNTTPFTRSWYGYGDFADKYKIGGVEYEGDEICGNVSNVNLGPTASNPAGVYYCDKDVWIYGNVQVNGTLVVKGTFRIEDVNSTITPVADYGFPALYVEKGLNIRKNAAVVFNGDIHSDGGVNLNGDVSNAIVVINGSMYLKNDAIKAVSVSGTYSVVINGP